MKKRNSDRKGGCSEVSYDGRRFDCVYGRNGEKPVDKTEAKGSAEGGYRVGYPSMIPGAVHICHCMTGAPRIFGVVQSTSEDGDGGGFRANAKSKDESGNEGVPPGVGKGLPETRKCGEETGEEDGASSTEKAVEGHCRLTTEESATPTGAE